MKFKIFIAGYFNRYNIGDDAFEYVYKDSHVLDLFKKHFLNLKVPTQIEYYSIDDLPNSKSDLLLLAGGDLLNDYFINKINAYANKFNPLIYCISCGGIENVFNGKERFLDVFDRICFRNQTDYEFALKRLPKPFCEILPDITFCLKTDPISIPESSFNFDEVKETKKRNLAIYFTQPLISQDIYSSVVFKLVAILNQYHILFPESKIYFVSFNTDPNNLSENDNLFYEKVYPYLLNKSNTQLISFDHTQYLLKWIKENVDVGICWRFHSHVFHIINEIPFWSFAQSNKVKRLLKDLDLIDYCSLFQKDEKSGNLHSLDFEEWLKCLKFITSSDDNLNIAKIKIQDTKPNPKSILIKYQNLLANWISQDFLLLEQYQNGHQASLMMDSNTKSGEKNNHDSPMFAIQKRDYLPIYLPEHILRLKTQQVCVVIVRILKHFYQISISNELENLIANTIQFMQLNIKDLIKVFKNIVLKTTGSELFKPNFKELTMEETENLCFQIAESISFHITTDFQSKYFYGIFESLKDKIWDVKEAIRWLLQEWNDVDGIILSRHLYESKLEYDSHYNLESKSTLVSNFKFDFSYLSQLLETNKIHRAGWSYCIFPLLGLNLSLNYASDLIKELRNDTHFAPIVDVYGDKTFGWRRGMYEKLGILPFKKSWYSFFHHTFETNYTQNNLQVCFESKSFIESLPFCKGIFVLSNYLKLQCLEFFKSKQYNFIPPVYVLYHPSEIPKQIWKLDSFINNPNRKIIQVGAWYRNTWAIYELPILKDFDYYKNPLKLTKYALKGKMMENYYAPPNTHIQITSDQNNVSFEANIRGCLCGLDPKLLQESHKSKNCKCDLLSMYNKYIHGMLKSIKEKHDSVTLISHLNDDEYDALLCENILFLDLVDASACNTLIECILRSCPILINYHPAVIEYLGEDYPLYYRSPLEAMEKLQDLKLIQSTHEYLLNMDKTYLSINHFVDQFLKFVQQ